MTSKVTYIVSFSNEDVLKNWFLKSPLENEEVITLPVSKEISAPYQLNKILDDLKGKQWLVFCDEWVRLLKNFSNIIRDRDKNVLYGITGALIRKSNNQLQIFDGRTGYNMIDKKLVDSVGQGCMVIHSSAIRKFDLMFDEDFNDKYMIDFSLQCKVHGMKVAIISMRSTFKERVIPYATEEFFRQKLREKYLQYLPIGLWSGTLTENSQTDLKTFLAQRENWIKTLLKEKRQLNSKVKEYEKTLGSLADSENSLKGTEQSASIHSDNIKDKLYNELESKLVWIFGTPRSGSTWLAHDILRHEKIRSLDETMIGAQLGAFYDNPAPHWALMNNHHKARFTRIIDRDRDDLFFSRKFEKTWKKSLRLLILDRIRAQFGITGYDHIVMKAPNESHASDLIMKCAPNSKLIFLVRDGRDVIDSRQGKFHNPRGLKARPETHEERKYRISHFALMWNIMIETTKKAYESHSPNLRLLVRYEDLRLDPVKEINRIYKFLGYDLSDEQIRRLADITSFENIPSELKGGDKNIRKGKPGGFREYFSSEELKIVNKMMSENLREYGYQI